ncbi:hypothetical protein DAEQUDRAFT_726089 [Daedalea quercina L-15889]|uniref:Uncharacterized protein n=1 Tax=Daedalea quercina L-15889 TaxID=1314783 RepID=A0A165QQF5_9APHY|nr:hypothetical protein DAEQUDRAFT_726089 [Daedalea quercina L-15889]
MGSLELALRRTSWPSLELVTIKARWSNQVSLGNNLSRWSIRPPCLYSGSGAKDYRRIFNRFLARSSEEYRAKRAI